MSLEVINSPLLALVQDKGRFSYSSIGVTNSGVMDEYAYFIANSLLGNELNTNIIEIAFSNIIFKATKNTMIVITGAKCEFFINEIALNTWQTYNIKTGDIIKIGKILSGSRVYLGVHRGFIIQEEFGSNSTTLKENLGGLKGDKLQKGDILDFKSFNNSSIVRLKEKYIPNYDEELILRVVLSYQKDFFNQTQIEKFFSSTYTITNEFNRMGCKLDGNVISCEIDGIISEGISFGAIQIPKEGKPIILLKDRQTIGGYPKIGSVLSIDCFKLSQCKPFQKVKFTPISLEEAQSKVKLFYLSCIR
jgi:biotin-dependent carboxylase-like uncharacterized protein